MNSIAHRPRLRQKVKHILIATMLCCGKQKDSRGTDAMDLAAEEGRLVVRRGLARGGVGRLGGAGVVLQRDFRKVSGISNEVFRQIEAVEHELDGLAAQRPPDGESRRPGEMTIRMFDPCTLGRVGANTYRKYLTTADSTHVVRFVEIIKRPGQTLGLYIREGDGLKVPDGVFISRIALESAVYNSGLLKVGDEILAVNLVDVRRMSLDDVVIIMSIPRRLVLTIRSRICSGGARMREMTKKSEEAARPTVVVHQKALEEGSNGESNSENGVLIRARTKGLPPDVPAIAVKLGERDILRERQRYQQPEDQCLYYNSQPSTATTVKHRHPQLPPLPPPPPLPTSTHHPHYATTARSRRGEDRYRAPLPPKPSQVVTRQPQTTPLRQQPYPSSTMDSLSEKVHPFYSAEPTPQRHVQQQYQPHHRRTRSMQPEKTSRTDSDRYGYWGDDRTTTLRRSTGMLRTEGDDYRTGAQMGGEVISPHGGMRRSFRVSPTMQYRGRMRRYYADDGRGGILRRPTVVDSASDTEVQSVSGRDFLTYPRRASRAARYGGRSHSLPRATRASSSAHVADHGRHQQPSVVRFTTNSSHYMPYPDSQEESDGAVSAPELPAISRSASRRRGPVSRGGLSPSVFTSSEYRQWMSRAPSTSAIYENLRRRGVSSAAAGAAATAYQPGQLYRVAHSAESLLDTLRRDEYRGIYTMPRHLHTPSDDSLPGRGSSIGREYLPRTIAASLPHPTPADEPSRFPFLSLDPREFNKYRSRLTPVTTPTSIRRESPAVTPKEGYSGLLWIHLLSGRGLRPTTHGDHHFRDLYCVIECDRIHKARTVIRTGEHSFDWDEMFELDLVENRETSFLLYSWDPRFRHKLCYKGTLHLPAILRESPVHSLALKMEPRGTLYLKLRYRDLRSCYQRLPAPSDEGVFGVELDTLLFRENSGLGVPLLIKRCTEEVEKRGMDIVGVYRLCGSALRKKILREEFERSAILVDLSVERVPDINVVTSLLKDFLRELPEPLLSKSLYEMLVDGLSVCLPEDPEGNAKLMFSILECLPKTNLCTVLLLLDHLRLVANRSDRNKMTPRGLATAFGPVLMCHAEPTATSDVALDVRKPISVMTFLVDMWPNKRSPRLWYDAVSGEVFRM